MEKPADEWIKESFDNNAGRPALRPFGNGGHEDGMEDPGNILPEGFPI